MHLNSSLPKRNDSARSESLRKRRRNGAGREAPAAAPKCPDQEARTADAVVSPDRRAQRGTSPTEGRRVRHRRWMNDPGDRVNPGLLARPPLSLGASRVGRSVGALRTEKRS